MDCEGPGAPRHFDEVVGVVGGATVDVAVGAVVWWPIIRNF